MATTISETVISIYHAPRKGLLSRLKMQKDFPPLDHTASLWEVQPGTPDQTSFRPITNETEYARLKRTPGITVAAVSRHSFPLVLSFTPLTTDQNGADLDLRIEGSFAVVNPPGFLSRVPFRHCPPSLIESVIRDWTAGPLALEVEGYLTRHGHTFSTLKAGTSLPVHWFQEVINRILQERGIMVTLTGSCWASAEAQKTLEREKAIQTEKNQVTLVRELTALQQEKETIEADLRKQREKIKQSEQLEQHQAELAQLEQRQQIKEAELRLSALDREQELTALQHDSTVLDLTEGNSSREKITQRITSLREDIDALRKSLQDACQGFQEIKDLILPLHDSLSRPPQHMVTSLFESNDGSAYQLREMLVSPAGGLTTKQLEVLGIESDLQEMITFFKAKAADDGHPVTLQMPDMRSRALSPLTRERGPSATVPHLTIGSSFRFSFTSRHKGYVTLLNLGTSGTVTCHVPNTWVSPEQTRIRPGFTYPIPGNGLIPPDQLRTHQLFYGEAGPTGWEHLVLLVSSNPLISESLITSSTPANPFPLLDQAVLSQFLHHLIDRPATDWTAGVLSFYVTVNESALSHTFKP